jgi:hypothetical protein
MYRPISLAPLAIATLLWSGSAAAQISPWAEPEAIGSSNLNFMYANGMALAVSSNPLAQSVAVWTEPTTMTVRFAVRRNGVWSGAKTLSTEATRTPPRR